MPDTTLVCTTPGSFAYADAPMPQLQPGHSILQLKRVGICGTDLHAFEGTQPYFNYPRILGHELAAVIAETEADSGFSVGEAVTLIPYFNCGTCIACTNGKPNCCVQMAVCGVHVDGGMRGYLSVPNSALVKGEGLSFEELALVEPLAIGAHSLQRAAVRPGETVLVVGAGPIGLGTMELARIAGAKVIAMDINEDRLRFCREQLGVAHTINPTTADAAADLRSLTGGDMPTVVIDATGSQRAINSSFAYMAHGARYVLVGLQKGEVSFSHPEFHKREGTLMSSRNALRSDFEHVIDCMRRGLINPANYITHQLRFEEVKDGFHQLLQPEMGVIKAMIHVS